jgi:hypothetical protein
MKFCVEATHGFKNPIGMRRRKGILKSNVYFEGKPGRRSAAKLLSKDEARMIVPELLRRPEQASRSNGT